MVVAGAIRVGFKCRVMFWSRTICFVSFHSILLCFIALSGVQQSVPVCFEVCPGLVSASMTFVVCFHDLGVYQVFVLCVITCMCLHSR